MKKYCLAICCALVAFSAFAEDEEKYLHARVDVKREGQNITYTLANEEPAGGEQYITVWSIYPHAAFTLVSKPEGWKCETDGITHLDCANTDGELPYPHDGEPGKGLQFVIRSAQNTMQKGPFIIVAWDHVKDTNGLALHGEALVPFDAALKEESSEDVE